MNNALNLIKFTINELLRFFMGLAEYLFMDFADIVHTFFPNLVIPNKVEEFLQNFTMLGIFSVSFFLLLLVIKIIDLFTND